MIAAKLQIVSSDVTAYVIVGKADIPLTLKEFEKLPTKRCALQTTITHFPENTFFMIHKCRDESIPYVVNYNSSGNLITYDMLSNQDKDSIFTEHP